MDLQDQVCSLELAKKLKELGVINPSIFGWIYHEHLESQAWACKHPEPNASWIVIKGTNDLKPTIWGGNNCKLQKQKDSEISAYTVAELGEMLPIDYVTIRCIGSTEKDLEEKLYWVCFNSIDGMDKPSTQMELNEADARATMLIYLIENELINWMPFPEHPNESNEIDS